MDALSTTSGERSGEQFSARVRKKDSSKKNSSKKDDPRIVFYSSSSILPVNLYFLIRYPSSEDLLFLLLF